MSIVLVVELLPSTRVCIFTLDDLGGLPQSSMRRQSLAIFGGICSESALVGYASGHLFLAMMLGVTSSAVLSWSLATSQADDPLTATKLVARNLIAILILVAIATVSIPRLLIRHVSYGQSEPFGSQKSAQAGNRGKTRGQPRSEIAGNSFYAAQDAYSGIVLWPKKQIQTKLIAPPPLSWDQKLVGTQRSSPLVIPFNGVYWLFREPDTRPPAKSREAQGSPEMFDIHSTDWRALSMEAHQNLGDLVDLSCCSRIEIAIRNADRYPPSVSLELVLVDNSSPEKNLESLGSTMVDSSHRLGIDENPLPKAEMLKFAIPPNGVLKRFDEVVVVFRLEGYRARSGAKIAIDHFTMVPRGM